MNEKHKRSNKQKTNVLAMMMEAQSFAQHGSQKMIYDIRMGPLKHPVIL